jgi:RNA polymerase sigma-70 factor (ECF subfamily)
MLLEGVPPVVTKPLTRLRITPPPPPAARADTSSAVADTDDETLARRARHDRAAMGELYARYVDRVYAYLLARVGSAADAQDLTSQTFIALLEHIQGYDERGKFAAWLFSIARNKTADHYRRSRLAVPLEEADDLPHPDPHTDETVERRLRLARVLEALPALTADRAEALALRFFAGLSAAEAGAVMGRSESAVKMLVHRGISDLQARLSDALYEGDE